jgi:Fungal specific transcription factor domain
MAAMLSGSPVFKHALLSLSCTYILDYNPDERIREAGNQHYKKAVTLLSRLLRDPRTQGIAKADDVIGAISLLNMHDVVHWELRRGRDQLPRWLEGARLGCKILGATDSGIRYYHPKNVQADRARVSNTITIGRVAILALLFAPLDTSNTKKEQFGWLLYGEPKDMYKIHGSCGFCPKIMHTFAKITHLSAQMIEV